MKCGILVRGVSFWVGFHYSYKCKRLCVNLLPCITIWITFNNGLKPDKKLM